jgi:primosomal protein N' (replication factor Y)
VILGSFAPSIESYWNVENQKTILKSENTFFKTYINYPKVDIVNMDKEKSFQRIISFQLQQRIIQCLKRGEKIILFHNRRGFAGYLICSQCGHVIKCPECGHLLTYHVEGDAKYAICHSCGKKVKIEKYCPECGNGKIKPLGFGTQHVEIFIKRMFPRTVVQRLDIDIAPRFVSQRKIINNFNRGKIDILIGTQLMFRELDFQKVGLVGIVLADCLLNLPNYKSAELSFQYFNQLALSLTAKEELKTLIIQTFQAEHHSVRAIEKMDYSFFYNIEIMTRKELNYPPIDKMIKIEFISRKREKVQKSAFEFIDYMYESKLMSKDDLDLQLNKENIIVVRDKDKNKANCILKIDTQKMNIDYLKGKLFGYISKFKPNDVKLVIDVDPMRIN